jgi:hypothetical protein
MKKSIVENLPAIAKAAALSVLIAVGSLIMAGCDLGAGPASKPGTEQGEDEKDKEYDWTDAINQLHDVRSVTATPIYSDSVNLSVKNAITNTAVTVAGEVDDMRRNVLIYTNLRKYQGATKGMPSPEFLTSITDFNALAFINGHNGRNYKSFDVMMDAVTNLDGMVKDEDKELFKAYIMALRSVNFISARDQVNNDYEASINLGNGSTTVGALLQNINDLNGEGTDYQLSGTYPTTANLHAAASALLPNADNAYPGLIKDVITEMGNMEQLLGLLERGYVLGKTITFSPEALQAIAVATDGDAHSGIIIDKPEYYTN